MGRTTIPRSNACWPFLSIGACPLLFWALVLVPRLQDKFDGQDKEAMMLIKLSVTDEMLPEVQAGKTSAAIWKHLKETHEISDKG